MSKADVPVVEECVVQVYQDDDGKWWRYCLTCDNGSNKYGKHRRGHKSEADAMMSKRDHEKQMRKNRIARVYRVRWMRAIVLAKTWSEFQDLWWAYFASYDRGYRSEETSESLATMKEIQKSYQDILDKEEQERERRSATERTRQAEAADGESAL